MSPLRVAHGKSTLAAVRCDTVIRRHTHRWRTMRKAGLHVEPHADPSLMFRGGPLALAMVVVAGAIAIPAPTRAADPAGVDGQQELAETLGGVPNDFELLYERTANVEHSQATLWSAKYVDHRTDEIHVLYRDAAAGAVAGGDLLTERVGAVEA